MKHPIQPLELDDQKTMRFKANKIVLYLLDKGPFDMNDIAEKDFPREDREQFAQLIGYSLGGFADLGYVRDTTYEAAEGVAEGSSEDQARISTLEAKLAVVRKGMLEIVPELFRIHPDDLKS